MVESVGGALGIASQRGLRVIDFSSLVSLGADESLEILGNENLPNCYATDIRDRLFANGWSGTVHISGNDESGTCP